MRRAHAFVTLVLLVLAAGATAQTPRPMAVDDEIDRVQVSSPEISPDGKWVVFVRSDLDWKENKRESRLFLVSAEAGEARAFSRGPGDRSPRWSPDGRFVAFLRETEVEERSGKESKKKAVDAVWVMSASGGEASQLTSISEAIKDFVWAPGSDRIAFYANDPPNPEEKKKREDGDDAIYVFEGPNGQGRDQWSNIWVVGLLDRKSTQVTREKMLVSSLDISPDGQSVAFIYRRENARNNGHLAEVGLARLDDGKVVRLTENRAPESSVKWHPDGRKVSYLAPDDKNWELKEQKLYLLAVEERQPRLMAAGFEGAISHYAWSTDGRGVLLEVGVKTNGWIAKLDVSSGKVDPLIDRPGVASDVSFSSDGRRAALVWSDALTAPDVHVADLTERSLRRVTDLNPGLRNLSLASVEVMTWTSRDGLPIEGLLYLPPGHQKGKPVPLILTVHGGPAGVFANSWRAQEHMFAGLGYASLLPNVRGSSAYGDALLRGNMRDIGGGDYEDLMSGVDRLIADGVVDGEKLGIRGWSYGGILGGWVITQTNRFKAAALGAMVSDWTSEYGQGFSHDVRLWYIGGEPWTNPVTYRHMSALTHVGRVTTPTLVLHGEEDTTDTIEQSMNFFNALWEQGKPTRFIRFPREPHGLREPRHQRTRMVEEIAWMQKYVLGIDWTDERADNEKDEPTAGPTDSITRR